MHIVETNIEVRYQETDQMGVVYHANYLVWFEIGRTKYLEAIGHKYADIEKQNMILPVIDAQVSYKKSAKYGETVTIKSKIKSYDGLRIVYAYEVFDQSEQLLASGTTTHVVVRKDNFKPLILRKAYPSLHSKLTNAVSGE